VAHPAEVEGHLRPRLRGDDLAEEEDHLAVAEYRLRQPQVDDLAEEEDHLAVAEYRLRQLQVDDLAEEEDHLRPRLRVDFLSLAEAGQRDVEEDHLHQPRDDFLSLAVAHLDDVEEGHLRQPRGDDLAEVVVDRRDVKEDRLRDGFPLVAADLHRDGLPLAEEGRRDPEEVAGHRLAGLSLAEEGRHLVKTTRLLVELSLAAEAFPCPIVRAVPWVDPALNLVRLALSPMRKIPPKSN